MCPDIRSVGQGIIVAQERDAVRAQLRVYFDPIRAALLSDLNRAQRIRGREKFRAAMRFDEDALVDRTEQRARHAPSTTIICVAEVW